MRIYKMFLIIAITMHVGSLFSSCNDKVNLKWNPSQEDKFHLEMKIETETNSTSQYKSIKPKLFIDDAPDEEIVVNHNEYLHMTNQLGMKTTVIKVSDRDELTLESDFDYITFSLDQDSSNRGKISFSYDSRQDNKEAPPILKDKFDNLLKMQKIERSNRKGEVLNEQWLVKNSEGEIKNIVEAEVLADLQKMNSTIKRNIYPDHPVAIGDSWFYTVQPYGTCTCTLVSRSNGVSTINTKLQIAQSDKHDEATTTMFGNLTGEMKLDEEKGTILSSHSVLNLKSETRKKDQTINQSTVCVTVDFVTKVI